jgi:hypothetical protein
MPSLAEEFQEEITSGTKSVAELLRLAKRLAAKLEVQGVEWITHELEGYGEDTTIPKYRYWTGILMAHNPYRGWLHVAGANLPEWPNGEPISVIEDHAKRDMLEIKPPMQIPLQDAYGDTGITSRFAQKIVISGSAFRGMVEAVRNRLFNWSIELAKKPTKAEERTRRQKSRNRKGSAAENPSIQCRPSVFSIPTSPPNESLVALMMPFDASFRAVHDAIKLACNAEGYECKRVDDIWENSILIQDVFSLIYTARIVICDFTSRNPNVTYEAGIAHTLGREVIPLAQHDTDIPFDLRHHRYVRYLPNEEGLVGLRAAIRKRLVSLSGPAL